MANHTFAGNEKIHPSITGRWSGKFRTPVGAAHGRVSVAGHPTPRLYSAWIAADEAGSRRVLSTGRPAQVVNLAIPPGKLAASTDYWLFIEPANPVTDGGASVVELSLTADTAGPVPPVERRVGKPDRRAK